jgi:6-phosphofructokinase 1
MAKKFAILTSGGDAPGMNASIRSIVRVGTARGITIMGVLGGYQGLIEGDLVHLGPRSVSNTLQRGGTILRTSRSEEFKTAKGRLKAKAVLEKNNIDALMVIGGDGSFRGACALAKVWRGQIIGLPGTIDNDLYGTDYTIGYDTAVNTALESIDKIRDTAEAHERMFLVEVMGRHAGFIALESGVAGGAEEILLPEKPCDLKAVAARLADARKKGKTSSLIIVAEGCAEGKAYEVAEKLKKMNHGDYRVVVLGYLQRGGKPSARDRILATKLGAYAVHVAVQGISGVMVGEVSGEMVTTSLEDTWEKKKPLDPTLVTIAPILAT